jgi:hypothetical protein
MTRLSTLCMAALLAVSLLFGGCQKKSLVGESCASAEDCEGSLRCVRQVCVDCYPACRYGLICVEGECTPDPDSARGDDQARVEGKRIDDTGGICGKAAACCEKVSEASGNIEAAKNCTNLRKIGVPDSACQSSFDAFEKSAEALKITCE